MITLLLAHRSSDSSDDAQYKSVPCQQHKNLSPEDEGEKVQRARKVEAMRWEGAWERRKKEFAGMDKVKTMIGEFCIALTKSLW